METRILSLGNLRPYKLCSIFGYTSNGLPGLEIVGKGPTYRVLKEKIIYITKERKLKIPLKRFVISLNVEEDFPLKTTHQLELPVLILYWSLAGILNIQNLFSCLSLGRLDCSGSIELPNLDLEKIEEMSSFIESKQGLRPSFILSKTIEHESLSEVKAMDCADLFQGIPAINCYSSRWREL
jgi:hypothetical protein